MESTSISSCSHLASTSQGRPRSGSVTIERSSPVLNKPYRVRKTRDQTTATATLKIPTEVKERSFSASPTLQVRMRQRKMKKPAGDVRPKSLAAPEFMNRRISNQSDTDSMTLLEALNDKRMKIGFRKFLESEFSVENLDFWLACEEYKKAKPKEARRNAALDIYAKYVSPDAPLAVNLDYLTKQQIMQHLDTGEALNLNLFKGAQRYVFIIMENDSYSRFIRSKFYEICLSPGRRSPRQFFQDMWSSNSRSRGRSISPSRSRSSPSRLTNDASKNANNNNAIDKLIHCTNRSLNFMITPDGCCSTMEKRSNSNSPVEEKSSPDIIRSVISRFRSK